MTQPGRLNIRHPFSKSNLLIFSVRFSLDRYLVINCSVQLNIVHKAGLTIIRKFVTQDTHNCSLYILTGVHIKQVNFRENEWAFCWTHETVHYNYMVVPKAIAQISIVWVLTVNNPPVFVVTPWSATTNLFGQHFIFLWTSGFCARTTKICKVLVRWTNEVKKKFLPCLLQFSAILTVCIHMPFLCFGNPQ